jgi:hypothetical protein
MKYLIISAIVPDLELGLFTNYQNKKMTTTTLRGSEPDQQVSFKIKRNVVLVFIILFLTGGSTLYAQDTKSKEQERTEKRINKEQRKSDRDKTKLDRKEMKMQKKERKMDRMQRKADEKV